MKYGGVIYDWKAHRKEISKSKKKLPVPPTSFSDQKPPQGPKNEQNLIL